MNAIRMGKFDGGNIVNVTRTLIRMYDQNIANYRIERNKVKMMIDERFVGTNYTQNIQRVLIMRLSLNH